MVVTNTRRATIYFMPRLLAKQLPGAKHVETRTRRRTRAYIHVGFSAAPDVFIFQVTARSGGQFGPAIEVV
jgi:hypothetical protein